MTAESDINSIADDHYKKVYKLCLYYFRNAHDAEDATQQVFLKVMEKLDTFKGDADVFTWVYRIAVNTCLSIIRKMKMRQWLSLETVAMTGTPSHPDHPWQSNDPASVLECEQQHQAELAMLETALATLSNKERTAFYLFHYERLRQRQIAEIMQISVGSVEVLVHKGMKKIKKLVKV